MDIFTVPGLSKTPHVSLDARAIHSHVGTSPDGFEALGHKLSMFSFPVVGSSSFVVRLRLHFLVYG